MPIRIRLLADYSEWPLWGPSGGPLSEADLNLSGAIRARIKAWFNAYSTPREDWPMWVPPAGARDDDEVEAAWVAEGEAISAEIQAELGDRCVVVSEA